MLCHPERSIIGAKAADHAESKDPLFRFSASGLAENSLFALHTFTKPGP
jgi:hypothetical protein